MKAALVLALLVVPAAAWAQAPLRTIDDCERFEEPLAYNACLAKFGPERGAGPQTTSEVSDDKDDGRGRERKSAALGSGGGQEAKARPWRTSRSRNGRVSASFDVSPYFSGKSSRRHYGKRSYGRRH
ncbi:hypothetical protein [Chelatococcus reniformis]|uniref:DUF1190 domain-containing protein n=1 Tax=Chelatococcus reniformis TaxID=1494448 RepID=A0A916UYY1_9HYPH|nr:hypothetical protein [Chelatococcus reniformis]GGC93657.1 hypothetical protein GCM10010994_59330 [Chelatococcus reniformis]